MFTPGKSEIDRKCSRQTNAPVHNKLVRTFAAKTANRIVMKSTFQKGSTNREQKCVLLEALVPCNKSKVMQRKCVFFVCQCQTSFAPFAVYIIKRFSLSLRLQPCSMAHRMCHNGRNEQPTHRCKQRSCLVYSIFRLNG